MRTFLLLALFSTNALSQDWGRYVGTQVSIIMRPPPQIVVCEPLFTKPAIPVPAVNVTQKNVLALPGPKLPDSAYLMGPQQARKKWTFEETQKIERPPMVPGFAK